MTILMAAIDPATPETPVTIANSVLFTLELTRYWSDTAAGTLAVSRPEHLRHSPPPLLCSGLSTAKPLSRRCSTWEPPGEVFPTVRRRVLLAWAVFDCSRRKAVATSQNGLSWRHLAVLNRSYAFERSHKALWMTRFWTPLFWMLRFWMLQFWMSWVWLQHFWMLRFWTPWFWMLRPWMPWTLPILAVFDVFWMLWTLDAMFLDVAYLGFYGFGCFNTEPPGGLSTGT